MTSTTTKQLISLMGWTAALTVTSAFAQVPGSQTGDPMPAQPAKPPVPGMVTVAPAAPQAAPAATGSEANFPVAGFSFSGNTAQSEAALAPVVAPYVGKSLTLEQMREAAAAVQSHYRAKGWFLAQAYIPAQTPRDGVVQIAVLEGRIGQVTVKVADNAPVSESYANGLANHFLQSGQLITENGIEGPLLLLRDVPRVDAKSVIDPGAAVGTANIVVNVGVDPAAQVISGRAEIDNYGNRVSGTIRLGGELNVNNPFGYGDQLSLRALRAVHAKEGGNNFARIGYSVLAGAAGTRLGVSAARVGYVLGGEFAALEPNGVAKVFSANVVRPLIRTKDHNMFVELTAEHKRLTDRLQSPPSEEESKLTSARLQLSGDVLDRWSGLNVYSISAAIGRLEIVDAGRLDIDQQPDGPHTEGNFTKMLYSIERLQQITRGVQGKLSVSGQVANKNLHSAEKFAIGGESTVRAFPVGALVGDQGYVATAELRWTIPQLQTERLSLVNTLFYDMGRVTVHHDATGFNDGANSRKISGFGLGLNVGFAERTQLRLSAAWPRDREQSSTDSTSGPRIWGQLSYRF